MTFPSYLGGGLPADPSDAASSLASSSPTGFLGELDDSWLARSDEEAGEVIREVGTYCRTTCPVVNRCVEERCRLWRLEQKAVARLQRAEERGDAPWQSL